MQYATAILSDAKNLPFQKVQILRVAQNDKLHSVRLN
jgi:hypothetical protein